MYNFGFNLNIFCNPFMGIFAPSPMPQLAFAGFQAPTFQSGYYGGSIFQQYFDKNQMPYNKTKGEALVQNAIAGTPAVPPSIPQCARFVNNALVNTGIGFYSYANGNQTQYDLRQNMNFKEIKISGDQLAYLPAGSTIVYDAFDHATDKNGNEYNVGKFGHVLIAKGDGTGISDRFEETIIPSDNAHVFIPV